MKKIIFDIFTSFFRSFEGKVLFWKLIEARLNDFELYFKTKMLHLKIIEKKDLIKICYIFVVIKINCCFENIPNLVVLYSI